MNKKIQQQINLILKERQNKYALILSQRKNELFKNKEFSALYKLEQTAIIENAKAQVNGEKENYDINAIQLQKQKLLKEMNMPKNYLTPPHFCKKCNDTGICENEICTCIKDIVNKLYSKECEIHQDLATFDKYKKSCKNEKLINIYEKMQNWCEKDSNFVNILFIGPTGVGKTILAECMASELIKNEKIVVWISAFKLNQDLLKFHTTFDESKFNIIGKYLDSDVLFIDDLGTEPMLKNVTCEYLYDIISERTNNNKSTIITTNLDPIELQDRYGERITSRLFNKRIGLTILFEGNDLRLKK